MDGDRLPMSPPGTELESKNYQYVLAFVFAIEEINKNPHLLPNMSLGYDLYNVFNDRTVLENSIVWLSGLKKRIPNYTCRRESKSAAVLTQTTLSASLKFGTLLELYRIPQLTYGPFDPILNNHGQFPSLYQMAPKDTSLARGMVSLMLHFSWNWVGMIISEDEKGIQFLSALRGEMERNRVCIAFVTMIPSSLLLFLRRNTYHRQIRTSSANVVIIFGADDSYIGIAFKQWDYFITRIVWVTTSQWDVTTSRKHFFLDSFHGTLIFSHHHNEISGFKNFTQTVKPSKYPEDIFLARLWWRFFNCSGTESNCKSLENCSSSSSLEGLPGQSFDTTMSDVSYDIYNAVYAVAHTLHDMLLQPVDVKPTQNGKGLIFSPWQLHPFLKSVRFNSPAGELVNMNQKEKLDAEYDILNFWNFPEGLGLKVKVGKFSPHFPHGQQLSLSEEMIEWASQFRQTPSSVCSASCHPGFRKILLEGKPICCYDCIRCAENEISNETDMDQCLRCADHQYPNRQQDLCLQKAVTFLAYEDPLGKALVGTALSLTVLTAAARTGSDAGRTRRGWRHQDRSCSTTAGALGSGEPGALTSTLDWRRGRRSPKSTEPGPGSGLWAGAQRCRRMTPSALQVGALPPTTPEPPLLGVACTPINRSQCSAVLCSFHPREAWPGLGLPCTPRRPSSESDWLRGGSGERRRRSGAGPGFRALHPETERSRIGADWRDGPAGPQAGRLGARRGSSPGPQGAARPGVQPESLLGSNPWPPRPGTGAQLRPHSRGAVSGPRALGTSQSAGDSDPSSPARQGREDRRTGDTPARAVRALPGLWPWGRLTAAESHSSGDRAGFCSRAAASLRGGSSGRAGPGHQEARTVPVRAGRALAGPGLQRFCPRACSSLGRKISAPLSPVLRPLLLLRLLFSFLLSLPTEVEPRAPQPPLRLVTCLSSVTAPS
ncbi:PREDICTED: vomeronasal type-2 receptor 116-like [Chinchilla lanigera]|uniref:vomeronasal type-2 receptor 116-like n=1 Tax=Chinchilla lanigera TaxID=34839 RepID=UPI00069798C6|nr:PREDICTED: vomeronasal type-2 receptor 116-like [Chinchilla lanigera]